VDRAWRLTGAAALALATCACAPNKPSEARIVPRDCRIALPYVVSEVGDCTPRAAAAYDFAFCHLHYSIVALAAPPADKAKGGAGKSAQFQSRAVTSAKIARALSDDATFRRNVDLAKKYYESLQTQNPAFMETSLNYVRTKCENLPAHHAGVLQELKNPKS